MVPVDLLSSLVYSIIIYFMAGFYARAGYFFTWWLILACVTVCTGSFFRCVRAHGQAGEGRSQRRFGPRSKQAGLGKIDNAKSCLKRVHAVPLPPCPVPLPLSPLTG